eukprot:2114407-Amphidinium_carterae.1
MVLGGSRTPVRSVAGSVCSRSTPRCSSSKKPRPPPSRIQVLLVDPVERLQKLRAAVPEPPALREGLLLHSLRDPDT